MSTSSDAAEQVVRLSLEGLEFAVRLSGTAAKNVAVLLMTALRNTDRSKGKTRLSHMLRSGKELKVFSICQKDLKEFTRQAKNYGVLYTVLRERNNSDEMTPVDIIARIDDAPKIQRIIERFQMGAIDKASVVTKPRESPIRLEHEEPTAQESPHKENPTKAVAEVPLPSRPVYSDTVVYSDDYPMDSPWEHPSVREKLQQFAKRRLAQRQAKNRETIKEAGSTILPRPPKVR